MSNKYITKNAFTYYYGKQFSIFYPLILANQVSFTD